MKIVIAGGSGQLGRILVRAFSAADHQISVLSRCRQWAAPAGGCRKFHWDAKTVGAWAQEIESADVVINLAGRSVNCRYDRRHRKQILSSRVHSTRALGFAISRARNPPKLWLQSSTATIYAHSIDQANDEQGTIGGEETDIPPTWQFSIDVAKAWEAAAAEFDLPQTRRVVMRTAMVMSPDCGGVFDVLMGLVRKGLGGTNGSGRQFVSWIHEYDFANAVNWLIDHKEIAGPVNIWAPDPLPNREFMSQLRHVAKVPVGLPAATWMLEIGAWLMQTETELLLKSRRVIPGRLVDAGFEFEYPTWVNAVEELYPRWRKQSLQRI